MMRPLSLVAILGIWLAGPPAAQGELATFGTANFTVDESTLSFDFAQSDEALTLTAPFALANYIGGVFDAPYNWSLESGFALQLRAPQSPIPGSLGVEFYDAAFDIIAIYLATTSEVGSTSMAVELELSQLGTMDFSQVVGMGFSWSGGTVSSSDSLIVEALVVPEPSTWALLGSALLGWGAWRWRGMSARG